jgi:hypothetical protein
MRSAMNQKHTVNVCKPSGKFRIMGEVIEQIQVPLKAEQTGNFSFIYCIHKRKKYWVNSELGDISDPFRRTEEYLSKLYIEIE